MKKSITIKSLTLINFKGIRNLNIDFNNQDETDILGANGTGKTTVSDAVGWLWFGKDSTDRKDFEIKTLDAIGKVIPKIEHEVSAIYLIDGEEVSLKRILKENWVKKRGSLESEFSGNVTDFYWNDVPLSLGEFTNKVNAVLNEQVFKMITSPTYFNGIKWQDRRNILTQIAGEVSDSELAAGNQEYEKLIANLTQGKTLEDYKAQVSASVKKAKEDLKAIPTRIDEVERSKPEIQDFPVLEIELETYKNQLQKVDEHLADANKAFESKLNAQRDIKIKANNLKSEIEIIEKNARTEAKESQKIDTSVLDGLQKKLQEKKSELTTYSNGLKTIEEKKAGIQNQIKILEDRITDKRSEWNSENAKELTFGDNDFHCPTCKREFESGDVEAKQLEMLSNFKNDKSKKLNEINSQGLSFKTEKENLEKEVSGLESRIETGKNSIVTIENEIKSIIDSIDVENSKNTNTDEMPSEDLVYESIISMNSEYKNKKLQLAEVEKDIVEIPSVDNTELVEKRKSLVFEIDTIKSKLQSKNQIEAADNRIIALQDEERKLAQQIADVEKIQFTIENFIKDKIDRLENAINGKFKIVKFKMFDEQINGGLRETCEAMVNGVPYSDVNTASKINAGLDIINTLCEFYGVSAPIFIDNAESVHTLIETDSQLVRLVVSEMHKKMLIKTKELVA